ncbi:hypothetical protein [Luteibacter sp.]|jgi:hypothetical protein|uniref:hypothetical protein n=1 Tax=Luteibacter sp. TaxID=1886636 RepID=UPI002F408172
MANDTEGATVARHLQERYDEKLSDCRKNSSDPKPLPALLCSGILLRVTARGPGFDTWNPNPANAQPRGVSFSWLRRDSGMQRFAFNFANGYIILPFFYADTPSDGFTQLTVLCGYPVDAATNGRRSAENDGCGPTPNIANSGPCQAQGITTSARWIQLFGAGQLYGNQCGFNLKPGSAASGVFAQFALIRNALGARAFAIPTEIKIGAWTVGDTRIPLEAFFYLTGTTGLAEAKANQGDFRVRTGRWVPVIQMTLPTVQNGPASFRYVAADQQVR